MAIEADTCRKFVVPKLLAAGSACEPQFHFLHRCNRTLGVELTQTTHGHLTQTEYKSQGIPFLPLPEKRRIVAELDALQSEVDAMNRLQAETVAEVDALLPARLNRAFKGKL